MTFWSRARKAMSRARDSPQEFLALARSVAEGMEGVAVTRERRKDLVLELRIERSQLEHELYVGNLHADWKDLSVPERQSRIEGFIRELATRETQGPLPWSDARARLVPVVRGLSTFLVGDKKVPGVRRPFAPFLHEALVLDHERGMEYVGPDSLRRWGITEAEAFAVAHENLAACEHGIEDYPEAHDGTLLWVGTRDSYQSSRLLLRRWLESLGRRVGGQPVAIIPERGTLVIGRLEDMGQMDLLLQIALEKAQESPRYLSTVPCSVDAAGRVVPLELSDAHPLAARLAEARHLLAGTEYRSQKDHLDARFEKEGRDVFVASYGTIRSRRDGIERSYTMWAERVDSLLPNAELVALCGGPLEGEGRWSALVPWKDVERLAGDCLAIAPELDPPRYRTKTWPSEDVVKRLREAALCSADEPV